MSQGVVQEMVTTALLGALNGAKQKGQLKSETWPALSLDAPKRPEWGDLRARIAARPEPARGELRVVPGSARWETDSLTASALVPNDAIEAIIECVAASVP